MFFEEDLASNIRMLELDSYDKAEDIYLMIKRNVKYENMSLAALKFLIDYGLACSKTNYNSY